MKKITKLIAMTTAAVLSVGMLASCGGAGDTITVLSREEGSGTRGAFVELFGVEEKNADGNKVDQTRNDAEVYNSTSVILSSVAGDKNAIGYVSLGSLKDTVKALEIDGVAATVENVKNGTYKIARPFNIATKDDAPELAKDFISFIMSAEGQAVVEENGYISNGNNGAYAGSKPEGSITVSGSSSISPLMEKLVEAYTKVNTAADIKLQQSDSSTGMSDVADGKSHIGMASRELKDSELDKGLTPTVICTDGIAVIVHKDNAVNGLTTEQVKKIYVGEISAWSELN